MAYVSRLCFVCLWKCYVQTDKLLVEIGGSCQGCNCPAYVLVFTCSILFQTDELLEEARSLQLHIRGLPRRVREWALYRAVDERVVNMSTVLPLVGSFQFSLSYDLSPRAARTFVTTRPSWLFVHTHVSIGLAVFC